VFDAQFVDGADISDMEVLRDCAGRAGLDAQALDGAPRRPEVKDALRSATDRAWEQGVRGVPTLRVGGTLFYGDDQLELAAEALLRR
jgi:2-hydroxychromene-2-carboxylate isomerase